jgi:ankyrin repeat protein
MTESTTKKIVQSIDNFVIKKTLQRIHNSGSVYNKNIEVSLDNIDKFIEDGFGEQILRDFIINDKNKDVIKYLIDKDIYIFNILDDLGSTLNYAAYYGRLDTIKYLIEKYDINIGGGMTNKNALISAVSGNKIDIVKYLINNKANIHYKTYFSETALSCSVKNENIEIVKYLIDVIGNNISLYNINNIISKTDNKEIINYIVDNKIDLLVNNESDY